MKPTGYKTDDPKRQAASPYFRDGSEDGLQDAITASQCPPGVPHGVNLEKAWSYMYQRGYERHFKPYPCICDGSCREKRNGE
jgi:hypothetical protein